MPHPLSRRRVDIRATATVVEIFHKSRRVASHRILDDWGLAPLGSQERQDLLEVIEDPTASARP